MKSPSPTLLPLLRSKAQGDILAALFMSPERELSIVELAALVDVSPPQAMREVNRIEDAGLVTTTKRGHSRLIRVETNNPVFGPLAELMAVTFGAVPVLKGLLADIAGIQEAFIYGSWAARYSEQPGAVPGDIDVLVIGPADRDLLYDVGTRAGQTLHREVNIRRMTREVWDSRENEPFRTTVESRPTVSLAEQVVPQVGAEQIGGVR